MGHQDEAAVRILSRLIESPSTQTELFESDPRIQSFLRETVAELATGLGLRPEFDAMGNFVVRVRAGAGRRRILFFAYAMTHPANRMPDPFVARVRRDGDQTWVHGRGASEQKAAVTAALLTLGSLNANPPPGEVVLCVSTAGETGRHDAARSFMAAFGKPAFDWAIVGLGTGNAIGVGNKGRLDVTVTVRGRASHSSTPWAGVNAIDGAVEAMARLKSVDLPGRHAELGTPTLTVTSIRSWPEATHTVQDEVRMTVDRRLLPGDAPEPALAAIRQALAELEPWRVDVEPGPCMYPSALPPDAPLVGLLQRSVAALGADRLPLLWSHGAIDAGYFNHEGMPAVMLGPGDPEMFHTDDEGVAIDDVTFAAALYERAARVYLEEEGR
jgi:acetylornithine deacetylase